MNILFVHDGVITSDTYDDAVRVLCGLAKNLKAKGHQVTFLAPKGSVCHFAPVIIREPKSPLEQQIPADTDLVHFHCEPSALPGLPYLLSFHGQAKEPRSFPQNTVFVSAYQAAEHGGSVYVHYGLDFEAYGSPLLDMRRNWLHFTSSTQWGHRNLRDAIKLAAQAGTRLHVLGDSRFSLRERRLTLSPSVRFHGQLHAGGRDALLNGSRGLVFPVVWPEPFGLAVIESLYFGCPVFGTPYGALPELLGRDARPRKTSTGGGRVDAFYADFGCLSGKKSELLEAIKNADSYDRAKCHAWVREHFSAEKMAAQYLLLYEQVLSGRPLHPSPPAFAGPASDKPLPFGA
ncbi:MAG TPA: glycosyltransferase [Saprospiraceae bacterium]|nr:glycosyltransferase [Saprospiraceae bacterium]HNG88857.1 glycosyltransferase [Saprospiraceae bacterium]